MTQLTPKQFFLYSNLSPVFFSLSLFSSFLLYHREYAKYTNMWFLFWPDVETTEEMAKRLKLKKAA